MVGLLEFKIKKLDSGREEKLIKRCVKNDRKAQKEVYEYFFTKMYAICKRYLKNEEDAMEVLNTGMLVVFKKIEAFQFKGSFEGWVKRIMINKSLDFIKTNKRYKYQMSIDEKEEPIASYPIVESEAVTNLNTEALYQLIRELGVSQQMVFNLYVIEGYSHNEIADKIGITASTSRWHLTKAREVLQQKIKDNSLINQMNDE